MCLNGAKFKPLSPAIDGKFTSLVCFFFHSMNWIKFSKNQAIHLW